MPSEMVMLKGHGEDRFIFEKKEDYVNGKRRKNEKDYWNQYEMVKRLDLPKDFSEFLALNKTGYTIEALVELIRGFESSIQKLKKPVNMQIDKMYEGVENPELLKLKPEYLK